MISICFGVQKPAWQRPIPALTLRFIPSRVFAPSGLFIASTISPSVTSSQRQTTFAYSGFFLTSSFLSSALAVDMHGIPTLCPSKLLLTGAGYFSFMSSAIYSPIAGDAVSPGDSMPAASKKPWQSSASLRIKSPPASCALSPANEVMTCLVGICSAERPAFSSTVSSPSAVVAVHSLSSISTDVGPMRRLP